MKFSSKELSVNELVKLYDGKCIDLNPPYQRNAIWSTDAQKELLNTILNGKPIPSFFLLEKSPGYFEVVDGKQRALTILGFAKGDLETNDKRTIQDLKDHDHANGAYTRFLAYPILVTVIHSLEPGENIEAYYTLVNRSGLRLNQPELHKAEFYGTNVFRLITSLASNEDYKSFGLFNRVSVQRMNDVEYTAELVASMMHGITDKKDKIDDMFVNDINDQQFSILRKAFLHNVSTIKSFDPIIPIAKTRYRQKNDFYTLFAFIYSNVGLTQGQLNLFYKILVRIDPYIKPSQDRCEPLREYAYHCVTQSNSKQAREARLRVFNLLLLNRKSTPTAEQFAVLEFFKLTTDALIKSGDFYVIDPDKMLDPDQPSFDFSRL